MHDRKKIINLVKTAEGQVAGIIKMLEDDRYCIDISNQIMAVESLLKKANAELLGAHVEHCVKSSIENGDAESKIKEIKEVIKRF